MRGAGARAATVAALVLLAAASPARAQQPRTPPAPEVRLDVIGSRPTSVQGAVGVAIPAGYYVRIGLLAGAGPTIEPSGATRLAARADVLARFLIDPFRQSPWGFSAGAGVSLRADPGERVRPRLLVAFDLEGKRSRGGLSPSVQLGLGGGARGGIGLRWSGRGAR